MHHPLFSWIRSVFLALATKQAKAVKTSKHRPLGDDATGPDAAMTYRVRKHFHDGRAGRASTLRKAMRARRIENGERPLCYDVPGKRERAAAKKAAA
jgi:hypothetical protein